MTRSALSRRPEFGFLSLIPEARRLDASEFVEAFLNTARDAHDHARHSRIAMLDAVWFEHQGLTSRAVALRAASQADHQRACESLARLASICREVVRWAAVDWAPTPDVVGSGLTEDELYTLCGVYGPVALDGEVR